MFRFKCGSCDEWHEGMPDPTFRAPDAIFRLSREESERRVEMTPDLAVLDGTQFFIRTCMPMPIEGQDAVVTWGLWVSVSRDDFIEYMRTSDEDGVGAPFAGNIANAMPMYPDGLNLPVIVREQPDDMRPLLEPTDDTAEVAKHYRDGMPAGRASAIFEMMMHGLRRQ